MGLADDFLVDAVKKEDSVDNIAERFLADAEEEETTGFDRYVKDPAVSVATGVAGLPEAVLGVADLVSGGAAGKQAEEWGYKPKAVREYLEDFYSPEQKHINRKVEEAEGFLGTAEAMFENPSTIIHGGLESLPLMLGGAGIARGVLKAAPKAVGALGAAAFGEGTVAGGLAAEQIRQLTEDGYLTPKQSALAAASGLFTALFAFGGGKLATKLGFIDPDIFLAGGKALNPKKIGVLKGIGGSMLSEGLFEEMPQSAQEQILQNVALNKAWDEGVPEAAAAGGIIGAAVGGGFGALGRGGEPPPSVEEPPEDEPIADKRHRLGVKRDRPIIYALPDGSVGSRQDVTDYLKSLPKSERAAARAKILKTKTKPLGTEDVQEAQDISAEGDTRSAAEELIRKATVERAFIQSEREAEKIKQRDLDAIAEATGDRGLLAKQQAAVATTTDVSSIISNAFEEAEARKTQKAVAPKAKKKVEKKVEKKAVKETEKIEPVKVATPKIKIPEVTNVPEPKIELSKAAERELSKEEATPKVAKEKPSTILKEAQDESISQSKLRKSTETGSTEETGDRGRKGGLQQQTGAETSGSAATNEPDTRSDKQRERSSVKAEDKPFRAEMVELNDRKRHVTWTDSKEDLAAKTARLRSFYDGTATPEEKDVKYYRNQAKRLVKKGKKARTDIYDDTKDYYNRIADALETSLTPTIDEAAQEAATSLENNKPQPTEAQIEAGNYEKGSVNVAGIPISIENPEGSVREGKSPKGKKWKTKLKSHYGYIKQTTGKDKDQIDVFLKPNMPKDFGGKVFVVNQKNEKGKFDEHKVVLGVATVAEAKKLYKSNYSKDWDGINSVVTMEMEEFKQWIEKGDHKKPATSRPKFKLTEGGNVSTLDKLLAWFGKSKVVDENGDPLVVFHATKEKFDVFKKPQLGFHFAEDESLAVNAAIKGGKNKPDVMSVYLKIENPIEIDGQPNGFTIFRLLDDLLERKAISDKHYDQFMDEYDAKFESGKDYANEEMEKLKLVRKIAKAIKADGFKYWNKFDAGYNIEGTGTEVKPNWSWIALHPEQIKDAANTEFSESKSIKLLRNRHNAKAGNRHKIAPTKRGMPQATVKAIVSLIKSSMGNPPPVKVVMRVNNLPESLLKEYQEQQKVVFVDAPIMGAFHDGVVYLVASEMRNENDVIRTMFHETLGHYGLHGAFGDALNPILLEIAELKAEEVALKLRHYGLDPNKTEDVLVAAEEILANMAQTNPQLSLVRRAIAAIREFFRKHFPNRFKKWVGEVTDDEILKNFIIPARKYVMNKTDAKASPVRTTFFSLKEYESELTSPLADNIEQILNPKFGVVSKKDGFANLKSAIEWIKARSSGNKTLFSRDEVDAINLIEYLEMLGDPKVRQEHDMIAINKLIGESLTAHQKGVQAFHRAADKWLEAKRSRLSEKAREVTGTERHIEGDLPFVTGVAKNVDITEERILEQIKDQSRVRPSLRSETRVDAILKSVKSNYGSLLREYLNLHNRQLYERGSGNYTDSLQNSYLHELIDYGFTNDDYQKLMTRPLDVASAEEQLPAELKKGAIIEEGDKRVDANKIIEFAKNNGLEIEIREADTEGESREFDVLDHEDEFREDRDNWIEERYEEKKEKAINNMDEDAFPYYAFEDDEVPNPEYDQDAADAAAEAEEDYDIEEYITEWRVMNHSGEMEDETYEDEDEAREEADRLNDDHFTEWLDEMKEGLEEEFGDIHEWAYNYDIEDRWREDNPGQGATQYSEEPDYVLHGAENYREIFFNLPTNQMVFDPKSKKFKPRGRLYSSGHFDEDDASNNLIFHLRVSDRRDANGNSVLFIEEIQSDWAKAGMSWTPKHPHRQGFRRDRTDEEVARRDYIRERIIVARNEIESIERYTKERAEEDYELNKGEIENEDAIKIGKQVRTSLALSDNKELKKLNAEVSALQDEAAKIDRIEQGTKPAPFVTESQAWQKLAAKEIISLAVREGYNRVAWTNADQQVTRYEYGLRTRLDRIKWTKTKDDAGKPIVEVRGYQGNKIDPDIKMNLRDVDLESRAEKAAQAYQDSEFYGTWLALIKRLRWAGHSRFLAMKKRIAMSGQSSYLEREHTRDYEEEVRKALKSGEEVLEKIRQQINTVPIEGTSKAWIEEQRNKNVKDLAYWVQVQNTLRDYARAYGDAYLTSNDREAFLGDEKVKENYPHNLMEEAVGVREWNEIKNSPEQSGIIETENMTISDTGMAQFYHHAMPRQFDKIFQQMLGKKKLNVEMYDMRKKKELTEDEVVAEEAWEEYVKENNFYTKEGDDHYYKTADLIDSSRTIGTIADIRKMWEADRRKIGGRYGQSVEEDPKKIDQKSVNIQPSFPVTYELREKYNSDKISRFRRFDNQDEVPDMTGFDSSKRSFLKAAGAFAAWAAVSRKAPAAPLTPALDDILRAGDFHGALDYIAKNSKQPAYRATAKKLRELVPANIKLSVVEDLGLQGETTLDRKNLTLKINLRDKSKSRKKLTDHGMDEGTVLHEAIHAAIMSRYDVINIYGANPGRWGKRNADEALQQYLNVWQEFRTVLNNELVDGQEVPVWMESSYSDPDEFIAYAMTQPEMQAWLKKRKYRGKTLWAKLKAAIKRMLGINGDPTWLDAALMASSDVLEAAGKDKPDFAVSISLAKRIKGDAFKQAVLFKRGNSPDEYQAQNDAFREKNVPYRTRVKKYLTKHFAPGGLLQKEVFAAKISRDSEFAVIEFEVAHLVGELERAIKKDYKVSSALDLDERTQELMNDVMAGNIADVPERTKVVLLSMREHIDGLSKQYLAALEQEIQDMAQMMRDQGHNLLRGDVNTTRDLATKVDLLHTIQNNIGHYVHRSYKAFDDPKWHEKVPAKSLNRARQYLIDRFLKQGSNEAQAKKRAEVVLNDIVKNGTAYDSMEGFIRESKLGAKDLGVLKKRNNIAPEIRELLGEYKDPRVNFAKSATKMGRLIFNQKFLEKIREAGMNTFMWTEANKPPEATAQLAADTSEIMAPLNGLWVTPETDKAFKDALGKENMEQWYKNIVKINGMVKYGKTILSPTTAARNWISAAFFSIANGHLNWKHMNKSLSALNEYFRHMGTPEKLAYLKHLKKLGVVYDTPYAGEMIKLLADTEVMEGFLGSKNPVTLTARKFFHLATKFYQFGDDFWKIIGFENEKTRWLKSGMSLPEAEKMAAERVRNTYPTYSMVGSAIQSLRRFPLAGTFVSFPAEIIRTSFNMFRYTIEDFKTPGRESMARQRAFGLAVASSFAWGLQALSKGLMDVDDDEEEAVRLMGAPWNRNANLIFLGRDEDGNIRFMDVSFMDPYNQFKRVFTAISRGQPVDQKLLEIVDESLSPFLGQDILAGTLFEIFANKKESGGRVYKERDEIQTQTADITAHLWKTIQPGISSNINRTLKAINGEISASGRKYNLNDEIRAWVGFRFTTLDPKVALYYRSFEFTDTKRDANANITDIVKDPDPVSKEEMKDALAVAHRIRKTGYGDMHLMVKAAMRSGLTETEVMRILRNSNITKEDTLAIIEGRVPLWKPSKQSAKSQAKKAGTVFKREGTDRVMKRYMELLDLTR